MSMVENGRGIFKRVDRPRQLDEYRKVSVGGKNTFNNVTRRVKKAPGLPGQELVEFMVVLPILFLILFGVADLARIFHATVAITNAARQGARVGGLDRFEIPIGTVTCMEPVDPSLNEVIYASCAEGENSGIDISRMTVTASCPSGCGAFEPLLVTVTYDFDFLLGNFIPGSGSVPGPNLTLQRTAEMLLQ